MTKVERTVYVIIVVAVAVMIAMLFCVGFLFNPIFTLICIVMSSMTFGIGLGFEIRGWIIEDVRKELE